MRLDRLAQSLLGVLFVGVLLTYGWIIALDQMVSFNVRRSPLETVYGPEAMWFAAGLFVFAAGTAAFVARRARLGRFWAAVFAMAVLLHPIVYFMRQ